MKYIIAKRWWQRLRGLAWSSSQEQALFLPKCRSIHTFGMRYEIDLFWFGKKGELLRVDKKIKPGNIVFCKNASNVLEIPSGQNPSNTFLKDQSGQALVEMAFVLPLFLMLVVGFFQLGVFMMEKQSLQHATQYAAQVGSITNDDGKIYGALETVYDIEGKNVQVEIASFQHETEQEIESENRRYKDVFTVTSTWQRESFLPFIPEKILTLQVEASALVLCNHEQPPYTCV